MIHYMWLYDETVLHGEEHISVLLLAIYGPFSHRGGSVRHLKCIVVDYKSHKFFKKHKPMFNMKSGLSPFVLNTLICKKGSSKSVW